MDRTWRNEVMERGALENRFMEGQKNSSMDEWKIDWEMEG